MRLLATCLAIGVLVLSACGGGGGLKLGATGTSKSTGTGVTITPQGNCANLTCLDELLELTSNCVPSGSCTMAMSTTGIGICYTNGVKMSVVIASMASMSGTATMKNGSRVCYLVEGKLMGDSTSYVIEDPAGKTVATMGAGNATAASVPITCADGSTGTLDSTCGSEFTTLAATASLGSSAANCPQGPCAP